MQRNNSHIIRAKTTLDDEFYTSYESAKKMISPFANHFSGRRILCNCDNPDTSQVFKFLYDNFETFKFKRLICMGYGSDMVVVDESGKHRLSITNNGDFRTGESLDVLKKHCDVVISNPPFSGHMFIDFVKLVMENKRDLLSIGPLDGAKSKALTGWIKSGELHVVKSPWEKFVRPENAKSNATNVKVAIYTTFAETPFNIPLKFADAVRVEDLPVENKTGYPMSVSPDGSFSIKYIPKAAAGNRIVVPLHVFRNTWQPFFKLIDILNTPVCRGKPRMPGVVLEYI